MAFIRPHKELYDLPLDPANVKPGEDKCPLWLAYVVLILTWWLPLLFWRFHSHDKQNLRDMEDKGGFVLVANHTCYLDPYFVVLAAAFKQWPRFLAKDDLFEKWNGISGFFLARFGALPVKRDAADKECLKRGIRLLQKGEMVCLFPEATRRGKTDYPITLRGGAAFMARAAKAPIVPAGIKGASKIFWHGLLVFPTVSVRFGKPVYESDFDFLPRNERLDAMTWFCMREVHALSEDITPEEVDMDALYPGSTSYAEALKDFVPASRLCAAEAAKETSAEH